jgi:hypothetical protein
VRGQAAARRLLDCSCVICTAIASCVQQHHDMHSGRTVPVAVASCSLQLYAQGITGDDVGLLQRAASAAAQATGGTQLHGCGTVCCVDAKPPQTSCILCIACVWHAEDMDNLRT